MTERYHLIPLRDALENIHFPKSVDLLNKAKLRLKFEELFLIQLNILRIANGRKAQQKGFVFSRIGEFSTVSTVTCCHSPLLGRRNA